MYDGRITHRYDAKHDQFINRQMGDRSIDEAVAHWTMDAQNPCQLDALAFQLLCNGRRYKTSGNKDAAARWKKASKAVAMLAKEARDRLATNPSRDSHPGFWSDRSIGRPKHLHCDLFLPLVARVDLGRPTLFLGSYEPEMIDGTIYRIRPSERDSRACALFSPVDGGRNLFVSAAIARWLQEMGRLVALPLSAIPVMKEAA